MSEFLYERFLENPQIYLAARAFWHRQVNRAFHNQQLDTYLSERFGNGQLFYDGNPIINRINHHNNKAVRVIQESPIKFGEYYSSWNQEIKIYNNNSPNIQENVIVLTLTRDAFAKAMQEMRTWIMA